MDEVDATEEAELHRLNLTRQLIDQGVKEVRFVISQHHGFRSVSYVAHISDALGVVRYLPTLSCRAVAGSPLPA